jgi:hypothetical protein
VAALTIEYKAPHKLTLGHIYEGLAEMNLDKVVEESRNESVAIRCRHLVAAVITQGFSYMVKAGVQMLMNIERNAISSTAIYSCNVSASCCAISSTIVSQ